MSASFRLGALAPVVTVAWAGAALACTTMALGPAADRVVAYSYDFLTTGAGLVVVNAAGTERAALVEPPPAAVWTARHGSVTFNQFGLGAPTAGMNDQGLVVTLMWNDAVRYAPGDADRVSELEFIQFLLDTAATVDEALTQAEAVEVAGMIPIHYFLADATGATAALRFEDGRAIVQHGAGQPVPALANTSYETALVGLDAARALLPYDPAKSFGNADDSAARFATAAVAIEAASGPVTADGAFAALARVENPATRWQVAFDPGALTVTWQTVATRGERSLAFDDLPFDCTAAPLGLDVDAALPALRPLAPEDTLALLTDAFAGMEPFASFGPDFPGMVSDSQWASFRCGG